MEARASLRDLRISPRKVRLVVDMVRGKSVAYSLALLKFSAKKPALYIKKLLLSAVANWEAKNQGASLADSLLVIVEIKVDGAGMFKRIMTAPQGRGHRIRKRSSHVTVVVDRSLEVASAA